MTNTVSDDLWKKIQSSQIGHSAAPLSFTDRLARENGWDARYAARVVDEYRRFCFLAMTAGHPVTPSEQVDQAWHLHLLHTENYWSDFCGDVLGEPLHHDPMRGGKRGSKFHDWYQATLDSYQRLFGEAPPAKIWPAPEARFQDADRFRRINTASHWVIPKPDGSRIRRWLLQASMVPVVGACAMTADGGSSILAGLGGVLALAVLVGYINEQLNLRRRRKSTNSEGGANSGWWSCFGRLWLGRNGNSNDDHYTDNHYNDNSGGGDSGCGT